jgi:hypothetical protein
MKQDEMGWSCSMHGNINLYRILIGNLKGRNNSDDLGVDGRIILE